MHKLYSDTTDTSDTSDTSDTNDTDLIGNALSTIKQLFGHCLCLASRSYPKFIP